MPPYIRFEIRIISGEHAGRYLGAYVGGGLVTNPEARDNPDVTVLGKRYSLLATEKGHTVFADSEDTKQIIAELKKQGYDAELIDTHDKNADTLSNRVEKEVGFSLRPDGNPPTVVDLNDTVLRKATLDDIKKWNETWNRIANEMQSK